jgi:protein phosphatase
MPVEPAETGAQAVRTQGTVERTSTYGVRLLVGTRSDVGQVRELNEDSLLAFQLAPTFQSVTQPLLGLFAVADGMGGHEGGEVASRMALQVLADLVLRTLILPELTDQQTSDDVIVARLSAAVASANDAVFLARQKRQNDMGTTLTAALTRDDRLFLAHVGDCRAYLWNANGLQQLTKDHSLVANMVASGQIPPDELYTHPHRSVIYRCIGDLPQVEVDSSIVPLCSGDRIVLCSDGLWEMVRNQGIEDVMLREADPQTACDLLVKHANTAGGDDNISVIVILLESAGPIKTMVAP